MQEKNIYITNIYITNVNIYILLIYQNILIILLM